VEGTCKPANEHLGSIKRGEFFFFFWTGVATQEGLCSVELVGLLEGRCSQ
jgi:hypothetical protein